MTREETKELLDVIESQDALSIMKAFAGGADIECSIIDEDKWTLTANPTWAWTTFKYRVKPKPQYRPYKDMFEFIDVVSKTQHKILKKKDYDVRYTIKAIEMTRVVLQDLSSSYPITYEILLQNFTWDDGTPCGILEDVTRLAGANR